MEDIDDVGAAYQNLGFPFFAMHYYFEFSLAVSQLLFEKQRASCTTYR